MSDDAATDRLTSDELRALVERVFQPTGDDRRIAVLTDLPDLRVPDRPEWRERRALAADWTRKLAEARAGLGLEAALFAYRNVGADNADLPATAWRLDDLENLPDHADRLDESDAVPLAEIFADHRLLIAPTQFSTTAPLKLAAPVYGFRAATMPGFSAAMVPALRLDYGKIDRRVRALKDLLDPATGAELRFEVEGATHALHLDLRHRTSHASGGLMRRPGEAGNLPSGETYVVPYEGELAGDPSRSRGTLPVQFGDEVVLYRIEENQAVAVTSRGQASDRERLRLEHEPAYGNLAELGLGVLADFGVRPIGTILLDEKLGLHIAFGRSDHFGGQVGAARFTSPEAVVHIDRVYLPETQPRVRVPSVDLVFGDAEPRPLLRDHRFVLWDG